MDLNFNLQVLNNAEDVAQFVTNSWRPAKWKNGRPYDRQGNLIANAFLNREEWEMLDAAIIRRARQRLNVWNDVLSAGLRSPGSLAEWYTKWRVASEVTAAEVTMDFETRIEEDRPDTKTYGVPVPIISKMFSIGRRELLTARANGTPLESMAAEEAAIAVSEKAEKMLIDGETGVVIQGSSISGLRTLSARYQGSAQGDFGTLSNIYPTFIDLITQMGALRYHGPFRVYMANAQYNEMLEVYTDTGETAMERVLRLPKIASIEVNDLMAAGEFVAVQMDSNVLDIREAMPLQTRRWEAPNGTRMYFAVMMAAAPRLKTDYAGYSGIAHYTGA